MGRLKQATFGLVMAASFACLASSAGKNDRPALDVREWVRAEGADLYLELRGRRADSPVLIWLHGGPGGAERPLFRTFNDDLEDSFRVVYYDQRGAGRSFEDDAPVSALTVEQHISDLHTVIEHLQARHQARRVILVGHSWGSMLGLMYAARHPENVAAFVGVAQVVAPIENQREQYRFVLDAALRNRDADALAQLRQIGRPPLDGRSELRLGKLVDRSGGTWHRRPSYFSAILKASAAGAVNPFDIPRYIRANERSVAAMTPELLTLDLRTRIGHVNVPIIFFLGIHDRQVSGRVAETYLQAVIAPSKSLRIFMDSAHNIPFEEPQAFSSCLLESLRQIPMANIRAPLEPCRY